MPDKSTVPDPRIAALLHDKWTCRSGHDRLPYPCITLANILTTAGVTLDPRPAIVVKFSADATPEEVDTAREQIESLRPVPDTALREAAIGVLAVAEPDDNFDGEYVDWIVPEDYLARLRAELEAE